MNQFDEIKNRQAQIAQNITKSFIDNDLEKSETLDIEKAKAVPVGTKNKYGEVKQQDGTWKYERKSAPKPSTSEDKPAEKKEEISEYKTGKIIKQDGKSYKKQANGKWLEVSEKGLTKKEHATEAKKINTESVGISSRSNSSRGLDKYLKQITEKNAHKELFSKLSDKEHTDEDLGLNEKTTSKLDIDLKRVQDWVGRDFSEDHISSVIEQLDDAGISKKDLLVERASSPEKFGENILKRAKELSSKLREGLAHKDISNEDVEDILWGILMTKNN